MILFQIKNVVVGSFSALGLMVITPKTINIDALDYILYVNNITETGNNIPMGRNTQSELIFDVICSAKDQDVVQATVQKCFDYLTSEQFILDCAPAANISTVTNSQTQDEFDPTSGLNTVVLSMRLNYITLAR